MAEEQNVHRISDRPEFVWMLDMLAAAISEKKAVYASVPITTGPLLVEWYRNLVKRGIPLPDPRRPEGNDERRKVIIQPNLKLAGEFVGRIRQRTTQPVIDPSALRDVPGWRQEDYVALWEAVIARFADRIILADGWNYSYGCAHEFLFAISQNLPTFDSKFEPLSRSNGIAKILEAARELAECGADVSFLTAILAEAGECSNLQMKQLDFAEFKNHRTSHDAPNVQALLFKDETLDWLAERGNVAQFVSFDPNGRQRFCRMRGYARNYLFATMEDALQELFQVANEGKVNVRSFRPEAPQGNPFRTRLGSPIEAIEEIRSLSSKGLFCICNELVDECDGGVSGVVHGDWLEFAPDIFPRDVDHKDVAAMPRILGLRILERIYGHRAEVDYPRSQRVEFTITVSRRGNRSERTLLWEVEDAIPPEGTPPIRWPNPLSRIVGDKAFGLVVADAIGLLVPFTTVVSRRIPSFSFGRATGSQEHWLRTCPREPVPGLFSTFQGWADPFALMEREDNDGTKLSSVLCQESVSARNSGKTLTRKNASPLIEGVQGHGAEFMLGRRPPEALPNEVIERIGNVHQTLFEILGPTSFEWVDDGRRTWLVQLHLGASSSSETVIVEGSANHYMRFNVSEGLEALYRMVDEVRGTGNGILLVGRVGVTSHLGDLLRRERIPSRIVIA